MEILTPRLRLRPWRLTDKPALLRHADNPNIAQNLTDIFPSPYTEADAEEWLTARAGDEGMCCDFAIEIRGEASGGISVHGRQGVFSKTADFGYWLGTTHWGHGYMTEALRALVPYAFEQGGYHRLEAYHYAWNPASGRVLEKAGFRFEGCLRDRSFKDGEFTNCLMYGLLRQDIVSG